MEKTCSSSFALEYISTIGKVYNGGGNTESFFMVFLERIP